MNHPRSADVHVRGKVESEKGPSDVDVRAPVQGPLE